jgi:hypothetical protein
MVGIVCREKRFSPGGKHFAYDEEVETEMRSGLYAEDFNALIKRRDKCINAGGGYVEI